MLGQEWLIISHTIKTQLPVAFAIGFLLMAAYLVYRYRASVSILGWMRPTNKELD